MTDRLKDWKGPRVLKSEIRWESLYFYQKSEVAYQLTYKFCERFLPQYGDRTVDQMVQAARSCKQNIVEGLADGVTSTEMQMKLLNVARASLKELREDFKDYLLSRKLKFYGTPPAVQEEGTRTIPASCYDGDKERYGIMLEYCRRHNQLEDYEPYFEQWSDEEMCNCGITLCHMIDRMMMSFMENLEKEFITEGGIKERMHKARTGYRTSVDERLRQLEADNPRLAAENQRLTAENQQWQARYDDLKRRALEAYNRQQAEIAALKARLQALGPKD